MPWLRKILVGGKSGSERPEMALVSVVSGTHGSGVSLGCASQGHRLSGSLNTAKTEDGVADRFVRACCWDPSFGATLLATYVLATLQQKERCAVAQTSCRVRVLLLRSRVVAVRCRAGFGVCCDLLELSCDCHSVPRLHVYGKSRKLWAS